MTTDAPSLRGSARAGGVPLFRDIDFAAVPGGWTVILGPSGIGKSTILRLFAGTADDVAFEGRLSGPPVVAVMAQDAALLPWLTVRDNVLIGARLRGDRPDRTRAHRLLAEVGLGDRATAHPRALSGGQRQRVALARTLMEDRDVVLLDEPFSALDARNRADMQELTARLLAGRTVLLVTHDPAEAARLAHRIVLFTETGLAEIAVPPGTPPRPVDAPDVLAAQAALLSRLRAA